ncbi:MAG: serine/threonine-protein kinase [Kofleriaceae bacterium]
MSDDKRTKIGSAGPGRETGNQAAQGAVTTIATPAPTTGPPASASHPTSYLPQDVDPLLGQTLAGRYLISRKLGEGGMGAVYLATHNVLEKQVALKVLHGEFSRKPDLVERFIQEAKAASRIRHENVIDISDFGSTPEGLVFFAMELLSGHDLHEEVARARLAGQLLPWVRSKKIFLQICAALVAAHSKGIIHRDLKPENIYLVDFLGEADFVKLLDFGIAKQTEVSEGDRKLTKTGMLFGTPEYMSPEQARGEHVDARVDVYAMGCILFQLVTGRVPFEADNFMGVLSLHLTQEPPAIPAEFFDMIGAPRELAGVISRALEKDRGVRWQSIDELANAVRAVCGDALVVAGAPRNNLTANVPAQRQTGPAETVKPVTPVTQQRVRTQWTGNLQVPDADDAPRARSKWPLLIAVGVVAAGAAIAVVLATRDRTPPAPVAPKVAVVDAGVNTTVALVAVDAAAPAPPLPPLPKDVVIRLSSVPTGAQVRESPDAKPIGKTPLKFKLPGSREARRFFLSLKNHGDAIVELIPDQPEIVYTERLERGASGKPTVSHVGSAKAPGSGAPVTDPGPGSAVVAPPEVKPDAGVKRPPSDECPDPDEPCLKADPSRDAAPAP